MEIIKVENATLEQLRWKFHARGVKLEPLLKVVLTTLYFLQCMLIWRQGYRSTCNWLLRFETEKPNPLYWHKQSKNKILTFHAEIDRWSCVMDCRKWLPDGMRLVHSEISPPQKNLRSHLIEHTKSMNDNV